MKFLIINKVYTLSVSLHQLFSASRDWHQSIGVPLRCKGKGVQSEIPRLNKKVSIIFRHNPNYFS